MKKIISVLFISAFLSTSAFAKQGNIKFDQHFHVKNQSGSKIEFTIEKGKYHKRTKKIENNKSARLKYNGLKRAVKIGCGSECNTNFSFTRDYTIRIKKTSNSGRPSSCSIRIVYDSNKARNKVIARGKTLDGNKSCGSSIVLDNVDGKTADITITGNNW